MPKYVMTCSGMCMPFGMLKKYPALYNTIVVTTMFLMADLNYVSPFEFLYFLVVIPKISSIQSSIGISNDLRYIATASVS